MDEVFNNKLFEITELRCKYSGDKTVLHVQDLIIEKGKITAILGLSGIGKSTILETLGLMNRTMPKESNVLFYPSGNSVPINYSSLWYDSDEKERAKIRREHFSFIFQESNLMQSFTARDNLYIALMLQNKDKKEYVGQVENYIDEMRLRQELSTNPKIFQLSGGERQRLSFIRAIAPDFTVLFGDEPTGNLDRVNAAGALKILSTNIKSKGKSAVIVTHDIDLSVEYADNLILINRRSEKLNGHNHYYGYVDSSNTYQSSVSAMGKLWRNHSTSEWHDNAWMLEEIISVFKEAGAVDILKDSRLD